MFLLALCRAMYVKDSKAHWRSATKTFIDHKSSNARMLDRQQIKNVKQFMKSASAAVKSFIGFIQILSVSDSAFKIPWPKSFLNFLRFTSPFNFDFISVTGVGCLVKYDFFDSFNAMMSMPILLLLVVSTAYFIRLMMYKRKYGRSFKKSMRDTFTNRVLQFTMWIVLLIYPPISRRAIEYFRCSEYYDGKSYLVKDFTIECWNGKHKDNLIYGIIAVIIYPIGIPAFFAYQLWKKRDHLDDRHVLNRLGFLYAIYRRETYLWDIWEMLQKLFLTGIVALIFPGKDLQVVIVVMFDLFFLCFLLAYKPHIEGPIRHLAAMASVAITLTMYCGLILKTVDGVEEQQGYMLFIEIFLVGINSAVALYALKQILPFMIMFQTMKKQAKKLRLEKAHRQKLQRKKSIRNLNDIETADTIIRSLSTIGPAAPKKNDKRRNTIGDLKNDKAALVNNLFSTNNNKGGIGNDKNNAIKKDSAIKKGPATENDEMKSKRKKKSKVISPTKIDTMSLGTLIKTKKILADKSKRIKIKIKRKKTKPPAEPAKK